MELLWEKKLKTMLKKVSNNLAVVILYNIFN
jgi:hypothetical protein